MASSQVEITFGCVLRDRNRRHNDDDVVFKKNLKTQVISADENSQNRADSKKNSKGRFGSPEKPRTRKGIKLSHRPKPSKRNENLGGASSLVKIWEARLHRSNGGNLPIYGHSSEIGLEASAQEETHLSESAPSIEGESESDNETKNPDRTVQIESGNLSSVSDIIQRLKLTVDSNGGAYDMPILSRSMPEKSSFPVVTCSQQLRGRQAFSDLLTRLERERHRELESLLERNAVSMFPQRGRLQSMLRLRSLKRGLVIQDRHRSVPKTHSINSLERGSTILHLQNISRGNAATEAEQKNVQQSTAETDKNSKIEQVILCNKESESKMSCLQLQETTIAEAFKRNSGKTSSITSVTLQEQGSEETNKVESGTQGTRDTPFLEKQEMGWREQEEYEDEQSSHGEISYDWFTEISRPRTYWEDLRKSRYKEVMNVRSEKEDICTLLDRRTVSRFLKSGLRENIEKLIMSRVKTHPAQRIDEADNEEEKSEINDEDDLSQLSSQSPVGSWSSQDIGVNSTPLSNLHSTEMEMISDLKSQILQLQVEMSELRDSVKTCLEVNVSLQKSVHRENPLKRKCCVCKETQVESLLYRCGHMCTCLRCANELQSNGGKCPICRAKILDVVRIFVDSTTSN